MGKTPNVGRFFFQTASAVLLFIGAWVLAGHWSGGLWVFASNAIANLSCMALITSALVVLHGQRAMLAFVEMRKSIGLTYAIVLLVQSLSTLVLLHLSGLENAALVAIANVLWGHITLLLKLVLFPSAKGDDGEPPLGVGA